MLNSKGDWLHAKRRLSSSSTNSLSNVRLPNAYWRSAVVLESGTLAVAIVGN